MDHSSLIVTKEKKRKITSNMTERKEGESDNGMYHILIVYFKRIERRKKGKEYKEERKSKRKILKNVYFVNLFSKFILI